MGKKEEKKVLQSIFVQAMGTKSLLFVLGFIFSTTWIATIIYDSLKRGYGWIFLLFISIGILTFLFNYSQKLQKEFASDDNIDINHIEERPKKVLILFLSNIKTEFYEKIPRQIDRESVQKWVDEGFNSWKMPLMAINGHKSTLEKLVVLTSPESSKQFNQFKKIIKETSKRPIELTEMLIKDINDIEIYNVTFNKIYKELNVYNENDIVIDVTSGIKLYSIAGSYFALSTEKIIQYVDTRSYQVYQFNNKILLDK